MISNFVQSYHFGEVSKERNSVPLSLLMHLTLPNGLMSAKKILLAFNVHFYKLSKSLSCLSNHVQKLIRNDNPLLLWDLFGLLDHSELIQEYYLLVCPAFCSYVRSFFLLHMFHNQTLSFLLFSSFKVQCPNISCQSFHDLDLLSCLDMLDEIVLFK